MIFIFIFYVCYKGFGLDECLQYTVKLVWGESVLQPSFSSSIHPSSFSSSIHPSSFSSSIYPSSPYSSIHPSYFFFHSILLSSLHHSLFTPTILINSLDPSIFTPFLSRSLIFLPWFFMLLYRFLAFFVAIKTWHELWDF